MYNEIDMKFTKAKKKDLLKCRKVLKDSFWDYAFFRAPIKDENKSDAFYEALMDVWLTVGVKRGTPFVAKKGREILAVAILKSPKDKAPTLMDEIKAGGLKVLKAGGIKATRSYMKVTKAADDPCHSIKEENWYLALLAVKSSAKGRGIGSRFISEHIIPYARTRGCRLLTLNTNEEENRRFYERLGFVEFHEIYFEMNGKSIPNWSYKMRL